MILRTFILWILFRFKGKDMQTFHILFELGSLKVYFTDQPNRPKDIYWCDAQSPILLGPFDSLWSAMKNYEYTVGQRKIVTSSDQELSNNIIYIDFKNKSKIDTKLP